MKSRIPIFIFVFLIIGGLFTALALPPTFNGIVGNDLSIIGICGVFTKPDAWKEIVGMAVFVSILVLFGSIFGGF